MKHEQPADIEERLRSLRDRAEALRQEIRKSYLGSPEVLDLVLYALLADGHVLLEGAPGLGKTTLVKAIASSLNLVFHRIQFTPDLMPADIIGARILEETPGGGHSFRFERGPLFANVVLADEINRATPRTQSALLEAMEERQVTVFGDTMALEEPFSVIATQNPIEMEGTYSLPEAQLDRFICKIELTAPSENELIEILSTTTGLKEEVERNELEAIDLLDMRSLVRQVPGSADITRWVARTENGSWSGR